MFKVNTPLQFIRNVILMTITVFATILMAGINLIFGIIPPIICGALLKYWTRPTKNKP